MTSIREHTESADSVPEDGLTAVVNVIGAKVRSVRLKRRLTLNELAAKTGLSPSMVSTVERGQTSPSLATLYALAEGLEVGINSLFVQADDAEMPVLREVDQHESVTAGNAQRRLAINNPDLNVEIYVDTYEPGTAHNRVPSQHRGHEFGIVVEGTLQVALDDETYDVFRGDSIQFAAKRNHLIRNAGDSTARAVWVNLRRLA